MKEIQINKITRVGQNIQQYFSDNGYNDYQEDSGSGYTLIQNSEGALTCSCGRELIQQDENTYKCSGGYPKYHFDQGDIIKDKFGNILLKEKPQGGK